MTQPIAWGNYGYWKQTANYHPRIPSASAVGVSNETGVSPDSEASKVYEIRKLEETMRAENHPDLIVVAWGPWETKIPGVIKVGTADREYYGGISKKRGRYS